MGGTLQVDTSFGNPVPIDNENRAAYFAILGVAIVLSVFFGWCLLKDLDPDPPRLRRRRVAAEDALEPTAEELERRQKFVNAHLKSVEWNDRSADQDQAETAPECSVCLASFSKGDLVSASTNKDCPHVFHRACVYPWLLRKKECPMCRYAFLGEEKQPPGKNQVWVFVSGGVRVARHNLTGEEEAHV